LPEVVLEVLRNEREVADHTLPRKIVNRLNAALP
jgi:hypothetical protein